VPISTDSTVSTPSGRTISRGKEGGWFENNEVMQQKTFYNRKGYWEGKLGSKVGSFKTKLNIIAIIGRSGQGQKGVFLRKVTYGRCKRAR